MKIERTGIKYTGNKEFVYLNVRRFISFSTLEVYYLFPRVVVEKTISILKKSKIGYDEIPADEFELGWCDARESIYSVEEYSEEECVFLNTTLEIEELYKVIEYVNSYDSEEEDVYVKLYKISEMAEYQDLLTEEVQNNYSPMIKEVLCSYMRVLLDSDDIWGMVLAHYNRGYFPEFLTLFNSRVKEFILYNISARTRTEIEKGMKGGQL